MNAAYRRMEIVSILVVSGHVTARELAQEFGVCTHTIQHDVSLLSYGYPIYTKPGQAAGFSSWRDTSRTTTHSLPTNRKSSKNMAHTSWNCRRIF